MTRLVLHEVVRWVRAVGAPLAALAIVVVTPSLLPDTVAKLLRLVPDRALSVAWLAALTAALAWLATAGVGAALRPTGDERAAQRLQALRDRSAFPYHALVCVLEVLWTSPAGERIAAVDTRTGEVREFWLAERALKLGAFVLLVGTSDGQGLVDHVDAHDVTAARRHEHLSVARRRVHHVRVAKLAHRNGRRAAAEVIRAAEQFLG